jgi:hypothetical protein
MENSFACTSHSWHQFYYQKARLESTKRLQQSRCGGTRVADPKPESPAGSLQRLRGEDAIEPDRHGALTQRRRSGLP